MSGSQSSCNKENDPYPSFPPHATRPRLQACSGYPETLQFRQNIIQSTGSHPSNDIGTQYQRSSDAQSSLHSPLQANLHHLHVGQPLQSRVPHYDGRLAFQRQVSANQPGVSAPRPQSYNNPATADQSLERQGNAQENENQNLDQQGIASQNNNLNGENLVPQEVEDHDPHVDTAPSGTTGNCGQAAVGSKGAVSGRASCDNNIDEENDRVQDTRDPDTWAGRNPGKVVQPSRQRSSKRGTGSTEAANISRKMQKEQTREKSKELHKLVADVQEYCKEKAKEIGAHTSKKPEYILQLIHSSSTFKPTREPNLRNALVHKKALELNHDRPEGDRIHLAEVQKLVAEEVQEKEITAEEKEELCEELKAFRALKQKGARVSNLAAARDVEQTFSQLGQELHNLHERTGACGFAFITRSHVQDKILPSWTASADSTLFLREVMKTEPFALLQKFEMWACTRDVVAKSDTLLSMRTECSSLILDGLRSITGNVKLTMNYSNYDMGIVQKYKVRLTGWPTDITFGTPHALNTVDEVRLLRHYLQKTICYWEKLTGEQLKAHMQECLEKQRAGVAACVRKRKVRSDKGKPKKRRQGTDDNEDEDEDVRPRKRSKQKKRHVRSSDEDDNEGDSDDDVEDDNNDGSGGDNEDDNEDDDEQPPRLKRSYNTRSKAVRRQQSEGSEEHNGQSQHEDNDEE